MSGNLLVINVDIREIRVALIEQGIIAELHIERLSSLNTAGNIYLGKVSRVLPGMQAAFIDIGEERAAFLHVEDLVRPDDFEAYLRGIDPYAEPEEEEEPLDEEPAEDADDDELLDDVVMVEVPDDAGEEQEPAAAAPPKRARRRRRARTTRTTDEGSSDGELAAATGGEAPELTVTEADDETADSARQAEEEFAAAADQPPAAADLAAEAVEQAVDASEDVAAAVTAAAATNALADASGDVVKDTVAAPAANLDASTDGSAEGEVVAKKPARTRTRRSTSTRPRRRTSTSTPPEASDAADAPTAPEGVVAAAAVSDPAVADATGADATGADATGADATGADATGADPTGDDGDVATVPRRPRRGRTSMARSRKKASTRTTTARATTTSRSTNTRSNNSRSGGGRSGGRGPNRSAQARGRGGRPQHTRTPDKSRIPKDTPIREVVREGQEVVVQVTKEPIGSKGARVSSHISLPGRYVVYMPTAEHVGISKRIGSDKERSRLREAIDSMKPPTGGLVVRTVAVGLTKKQLKNDVGYLIRLWNEIARAREEATSAPALLYEELDLVLKTARDLFTEDVGRIVIDNREQYVRLRRFVEMFMPERADDIELYEGSEPVFDAYGIEDEIARALARKVPLASGGHLVIDQAEALTAIDVNTGRFVGKGSKDLEETILATNLEAVEEIAYQLRFRNIGGLIILDLIDMDRHQNREKVRRRLADLLAKDKAKTTINRISDLGLIEMTRKRTRESLGRLLHEPCFYCDGTGQLMSRETIAYEILRQIRREEAHLKGYRISVNAHPAVIDLLKVEEQEAVQEAERMFQRRIELVPRQEYHIEQFDLQGI